jgi:hypothetical protein
MALRDSPTVGDILYANVIDVAADDFSGELQLPAHSIGLDGPINDIRRS